MRGEKISERPCPQTLAQRRGLPQALDVRAKSVNVFRRAKEGVFVVAQHMRQHRQIRRDDGASGGHVFEHF